MTKVLNNSRSQGCDRVYDFVILVVTDVALRIAAVMV